MSFVTKEDEYELVLRSILMSRSKEGSTIGEIRDDFRELLGEVPEVFQKEFAVIKEFMCSLSGVFFAIEHNTYLWYASSPKTRHISAMIEEQKPPRNGGRYASYSNHYKARSAFQQRSQGHQPPTAQHYQPYQQPSLHRKSFHSSTSSCYFKDNNQFRSNRHYLSEPSLSSRSRSNTSLNSAASSRMSGAFGDHTPAYMYDYQLLGDDFFLSLALNELQATTAPTNGRRVKRSGLCISGQTIRAATAQVNRLLTPIDENIIVNIGSVDLLHGADFADMKRDFEKLMDAFRARNVVPIIATLAPLANHSYQPDVRRKWSVFNAYLLKSYPGEVLDITSCFCSNWGQTLHDCYQPMAKYVSGSCQPHTLWNRLGRQRVMAFLKREVYEKFDVIDR